MGARSEHHAGIVASVANVTTIAALILAAACSGGTDTGGSITRSGVAPSGGGGHGGCALECGGGGGGGGATHQLVVTPADVTVVVVDSDLAKQSFRATQDGADVSDQVSWSYDRPDLGALDASGTFTPTGTFGGAGHVKAQLGADVATVGLAVVVRRSVAPANVSPAQLDAIGSPKDGPDPSLQILYPDHETIFPLDVTAPEIQWQGSTTQDLLRIHFIEQYYDYVEVIQAPSNGRYTPSDAAWTAITRSGAGARTDPLYLSINRSSGAAVYDPLQRTLRIAQGQLRGSVSYVELQDQCALGSTDGALVRFDVAKASAAPALTYADCVGCHAVSHDGRTLAAALGPPPFSFATFDLATTPAAAGALAQGKLFGTFSAFDDLGKKLAFAAEDGTDASASRIGIADAATGVLLNASALSPLLGCNEPAWSPDGKKLAAICGETGFGYGFNSMTGYLAVADVSADGASSANATAIVPQLGQPGRPANPTFAPGSQQIVYARSPDGATSASTGDLWLVGADGSDPRALVAASGDHRSYGPSFAPIRAGGFSWLVFVSRRDYGNHLLGVGRQQLWMAAIDDPPTAADPSHPAFYLPQQRDCAKNETAVLARTACLDIGAACVDGFDCCAGHCATTAETDAGTGVCAAMDPAATCVATGDACGAAPACCVTAAACVDGYCETPPPM